MTPLALQETVLEEEDFDVILTVARDEEKAAAVVYCLSCGEHTIRTARDCAAKITPVGEKTAHRIMLELYRLGLIYFDTKKRKWVATELMPKFRCFEEAVQFVIENRIGKRY